MFLMPALNTSPQSSAPFARLSFALLTAIAVSGCAQMQQQMQQPGYYNLPAASSTTDAIAQAEGSYSNQNLRAPNQIQIDLNQRGTPASNSSNSSPMTANPVAVPAAGATPVSAPAARTAIANTGATGGQAKDFDASASPTDAPPADISAAAVTSAQNANETSTLQASLIPEPQTFSGTLPCFHSEMGCSAQRITLSLAPNGRWRARAAYLDQNSQNGPVQVEQGCWRVAPMSPPRVLLFNAQGDVRTELSMISGNTLKLISNNGDIPNLTYTLARQPDLDVISELDKKPAPNCP
jgi:hypothetical protein